MSHGWRQLGWVWVFALMSGCSSGSHPQPLTARDFFAPQAGPDEAPLSRGDQPGALGVNELQQDQRSSLPANTVGPTSPAIPDAVAAVVEPPEIHKQPTTRSRLAATQASTRRLAATQPSDDTYLTLGSLVAEVNGTPIYANKVLRLDALLLRDDARQYDLDRFEIAARERIEKTTREQVMIELEVAAAERTLSDDDKKLARRLTTIWRQHQIDQSGGSVQVAQRKALADGESLDEQVNDRYRYYLQQLYYARKVDPRVQVTAADERHYYQMHLATEFSKPSTAVVYIINADPSDLGDSVARAKLEDDRRRALAGADFAEMAHDQQARLFREQRTIERSSFALRNVVDAAWHLQPAQISDIISDVGGLYVIKLVSREDGGVQPFEDEAVQEAIRRKLAAEQFAKLREAEQQKLVEDAIIRSTDKMIDAAVQMATQNYTRWSKS